MARARKEKQGELPFPTRGGKRKGSGRKPRGARAGVKHVTRTYSSEREPLHVGLRLCRGVPNMQWPRVFKVVQRAFEHAAAQRDDFRVTHYSVQGNHMHLIVEADDRTALSRGMQGLTIRIAKALNRLANRTGKVFADRFWSRVLATPREVRNAIAYVLGNTRVHAERMGIWITPPPVGPFAAGPGSDRPGLYAPQCWLLRVGWTKARPPRALAPAPFV